MDSPALLWPPINLCSNMIPMSGMNQSAHGAARIQRISQLNVRQAVQCPLKQIVVDGFMYDQSSQRPAPLPVE